MGNINIEEKHPELHKILQIPPKDRLVTYNPNKFIQSQHIAYKNICKFYNKKHDEYIKNSNNITIQQVIIINKIFNNYKTKLKNKFNKNIQNLPVLHNPTATNKDIDTLNNLYKYYQDLRVGSSDKGLGSIVNDRDKWNKYNINKLYTNPYYEIITNNEQDTDLVLGSVIVLTIKYIKKLFKNKEYKSIITHSKRALKLIETTYKRIPNHKPISKAHKVDKNNKPKLAARALLDCSYTLYIVLSNWSGNNSEKLLLLLQNKFNINTDTTNLIDIIDK
eukprot:20912_1